MTTELDCMNKPSEKLEATFDKLNIIKLLFFVMFKRRIWYSITVGFIPLYAVHSILSFYRYIVYTVVISIFQDFLYMTLCLPDCVVYHFTKINGDPGFVIYHTVL